MLEGIPKLWLFIWTHLQPFEPKKRKNQFSGGKLPKRPLKPVHCAPDMFKKFGQIPMGPYPFGNLGIQPKMRSGRRFENQNQRLQPCTAPNCKNQFSGVVNCQTGLWKWCTMHQTCSKNRVRYPMKPGGPYPFGIFKIRPKIRLGRRFENSKENQHEFWTRLTTV